MAGSPEWAIATPQKGTESILSDCRVMSHPHQAAPIVPPSPNIDAAAICYRLAGYEFPWELNRALEIAVLKTFCVPQISRLLRQTGEFEQRSQKRYDDTSLILGNILKWGYDSPRGRAAIRQMNRIHQRFNIHNEDFLYVLSTLIYEPIRWNQYFGWRLFTPDEKQALFQFWRAVGQQMRLRHLPATFEAFNQFNLAYEAKYFAYHPDNQMIGDAVVRLMQGWAPTVAAPCVPMLVRSLVDEPTRVALGWKKPAPAIIRLVSWGMQARRQWIRQQPRRRSHFLVDQANRTYADGYQIDQLGPDSSPSQSSRCPFLRMRAVLRGEH
ncbi:MAG: oxygenase MpaB family protein [Cyanobacteria bacterium P01_C01_bin.70]